MASYITINSLVIPIHNCYKRTHTQTHTHVTFTSYNYLLPNLNELDEGINVYIISKSDNSTKI